VTPWHTCCSAVGDMLKITRVDQKPQTLRLEGDVSGPWVAELRRVCLDALGKDPHHEGRLVLDLAGVAFLDVNGLALFRDLARRQVRFTSRSLFIAEQLKGVSDVDR
jgi:ABC-type transporter Mla MlaB component